MAFWFTHSDPRRLSHSQALVCCGTSKKQRHKRLVRSSEASRWEPFWSSCFVRRFVSRRFTRASVWCHTTQVLAWILSSQPITLSKKFMEIYSHCESRTYLMIPSIEPVQTMFSLTATQESMESGWPGKRSLMSPHSPQENRFKMPSPVPQTTLRPP